PKVTTAASAVQTTSTTQSRWSTAPRHPASDAASKRTAVPAPSTSPNYAAGSPHTLSKAGTKGDVIPKAAYSAAYSTMKRGSAVERPASTMARSALVGQCGPPVLLVQPDRVKAYNIIDTEVVGRIVALHVGIPPIVHPLPGDRK